MAEQRDQALDPLNPPYAFSTQQRVYLWLTAFFVACLLIADIVGIKLFRLPFGFSFRLPFMNQPIDAIEHTCGMLTFPVTFLLTDLINEYFGKKGARRVTYIGLTMGIFVFIVMNVAQYMPYLPASYNVDKTSFDAIFGSAKVMYLASLCAYLAGQMADIAIFGFLKRLTMGKSIWLRATGSTVVSQMLDSFVVTLIAFDLGRRLFADPASPPAPFVDIIKIAATGYALKFALAVAITPLIYAGHSVMRRCFGLVPLPAEQR
ncbi:MAG: queuosine precursor transporter [Acidobacteria bacterium]|nr:queuosine precursor transporter [Acidobacteriota bacterium]